MKHYLPSDVVVGQYLQIVVLTIAAAVAFVYVAGEFTGRFVHRLNDRLTEFHKLNNTERLTITKQTLTTFINNAFQS